MTGSTLVVDGVTKRFGGVAALTDVSITARPGEITGLIGPNGAGKTTLFNCVTGFLKTDTGTVRYGDSRLDRLDPQRIARRGLVRTFQDVRVFNGMTALENLEVGVWRGGSRAEGLQFLHEAAAGHAVEIPLHVAAGSLSYGEQKVLAMARCLTVGASALLLDEPASGLDEAGLELLKRMLRSFRDAGKLVLLVEHNMGLVMDVCDRLFVLAFGRLLASGTPAEIRSNREVIDAYLGAASTKAAGDEPHARIGEDA
jgi:branched-chain amino acid transport system ATP-binding protein